MRCADYNLVNPEPTAALIPLDAIVDVLRPNLWSGCRGKIVTVYDNPKHSSFGKHRVQIIGKEGEHFSCDAWRCELRLVEDDPLAIDKELEAFNSL